MALVGSLVTGRLTPAKTQILQNFSLQVSSHFHFSVKKNSMHFQILSNVNQDLTL